MFLFRPFPELALLFSEQKKSTASLGKDELPAKDLGHPECSAVAGTELFLAPHLLPTTLEKECRCLCGLCLWRPQVTHCPELTIHSIEFP